MSNFSFDIPLKGPNVIVIDSEIKCAFFSLLLINYRRRDIRSFWWRLLLEPQLNFLTLPNNLLVFT